MGMMMTTTTTMMFLMILCCSNNNSNCRGSSITVIKEANGNGTYGCEGELECSEMWVDLMVGRFLGFEGDKTITDQTTNPNVQACGNGLGNPNGACGGSSSNTNNCNKYAGGAACK